MQLSDANLFICCLAFPQALRDLKESTASTSSVVDTSFVIFFEHTISDEIIPKKKAKQQRNEITNGICAAYKTFQKQKLSEGTTYNK